MLIFLQFIPLEISHGYNFVFRKLKKIKKWLKQDVLPMLHPKNLSLNNLAINRIRRKQSMTKIQSSFSVSICTTEQIHATPK